MADRAEVRKRDTLIGTSVLRGWKSAAPSSRRYERTTALRPEAITGAARILEAAASNDYQPLKVIAAAIADTDFDAKLVEIDIAKLAINESLEAGNWREIRAEAAAKLREGWIPAGFTKGERSS